MERLRSESNTLSPTLLSHKIKRRLVQTHFSKIQVLFGASYVSGPGDSVSAFMEIVGSGEHSLSVIIWANRDD